MANINAVYAFGLLAIACPVSLAGVATNLQATDFMPYPTYTGNLMVTGTIEFVQEGAGAGAAQVMSYTLTGTDPECGTANVTGVANACGIHIHVGTNCSDASTVGGHFWNKTALGDADPWQTIMYATANQAASGNTIKVTTGITNAEVADRVVVVHNSTGGRIACSPMKPMQPLVSDSLQAIDFIPYPTYTGNLVVTGIIQFEQEGTGVGAAQVMNYTLTSTDPECGTANVTGVANACGIHIHVGTNCSDASTVGGHFWNKTALGEDDPWQTIMYATVNQAASASKIKVTTGLTNAEVADRVVVVHDATGARIACSPMATQGTSPPSVSQQHTKYECSDPPLSLNYSNVIYYSGAVTCGNLFLQRDLGVEPIVHAPNVHPIEGRYYTLLMIDPDGLLAGSANWPVDGPALDNPAPILQWAVGNIDHKTLASGDLSDGTHVSTVQQYNPPGMRAGGSHRYVFFLFEQPKGMIEFVLNPSPLNFAYQAFIAHHGLGKPVASNWMVVQAWAPLV